MNAIPKPPYATAAATALRESLAASHGPLRDAVASYRTACASLAPDADLLDTLRAAGNIVLAAEVIAAAGKRAEATTRTALAQAMCATGCPAVALPSHVVHLGTKPARVDIENESAIPTELMRTPAPAPDKVAIAKLLRAGREVPGARLIGNQEPVCVFRSCSQ